MPGIVNATEETKNLLREDENQKKYKQDLIESNSVNKPVFSTKCNDVAENELLNKTSNQSNEINFYREVNDIIEKFKNASDIKEKEKIFQHLAKVEEQYVKKNLQKTKLYVIETYILIMKLYSLALGCKYDSVVHSKTLNDQIQMTLNQIKKICESESQNTNIIAYVNCLIKISKHKKAIEFLNYFNSDKKHKDNCKSASCILNNPLYWIYLAKAHRKCFQQNAAKKYIDIAQEIIIEEKNPDVIEVFKAERILVYKREVSATTLEKEIPTLFINQPEENNFNTKFEKRKMYKILSVDGGGIRGIIPAIWLSEIEKYSGKPISASFNLLAGTSTGGIISAGLSLPHKDDPSKPMYTADDILKLYTTQGSKIFKKESCGLTPKFMYNIFDKISLIFGSAYNSQRKVVFEEYFNDKQTGKIPRIREALTELVIPACAESNLLSTYLFTKNKAHNIFFNDTYVDVLMATTAAPTYFPSYEIKGKGLFNDGGIHANNPTALACAEAIKYGQRYDDLLVLSLGTGTYLPTPDFKKTSRGYFFWGFNLHKIALDAQLGNTDISMSHALGKRYKRWQVLFENEIKLDDYNQDNIQLLTDYAYQFIDENDEIFRKICKTLEYDEKQSV